MATLRFAKLHGTANDFVYVDAREGFPGDPAALAPRLCDRRRGIGADGLILLLPPADGGDCRMVIYNADGSRPEMCGNGMRGLAKFVHDRGLARANPLRIETDAGVKTVRPSSPGGGAHASPWTWACRSGAAGRSRWPPTARWSSGRARAP